ncbi:MAG TPA: DUF2273 domain-containing protein [Candidatus Limnocylindria bacterium]|nr:DUF2273 domain-containing protein [Candidatus Limnocylindria bacterium]
MNRLDEFLKRAFKPGTPQGRLSFGVAFFFLGLMLALLGFWKTLLIFAVTMVGVFIGSAETIGKATAKLIDKVIPPKNRRVVYTAEDLEKVRRAAEMKKEAPGAGGDSQGVNG